MIKANELRSGNIFTADNEPGVCTVKGWDDAGIIVGSHYESSRKSGAEPHGNAEAIQVKRYISFDRAHPIQITPEWLETCGFEVKDLGNDEYYYSMDWKDGTRLDFIDIVSDGDGFRLAINENEYVLGRRFHYVHQLQTLYFALTGEELPIKL
jgi:hypothetical protein